MSLAAPTRHRSAPLRLVDLELDLEVFAGPFDLLLTLILREEVDLLEVDLADVVISYIDYLESRGELDLEAATEFLVLITSLLELKSRLMLPGEEIEEIELDPGKRRQSCCSACSTRTAIGQRPSTSPRCCASRPVTASARRHCRRACARRHCPRPQPSTTPTASRRRSARCSCSHQRSMSGTSPCPRSRSPIGSRICAGCCDRGWFNFDDAVAGADRVTVAVTLFSLLELYKQGELTWLQDEPFGDIQVVAADHGLLERTAMSIALDGTIEALLFLSPDPVSTSALAEAAEVEPDEVAEALAALQQRLDNDGRGLVLRELAGGWTLSSHPEAEEAARRLLARPRTPALTPAQAETLAIIAYLQPVSRPEIARIRGVNAESAAATLLERGLVEESGRSQFGAVLYRTTDLFLRLFGLKSIDELPPISAFDPSPELEEELRERLLRAGEARATG